MCLGLSLQLLRSCTVKLNANLFPTLSDRDYSAKLSATGTAHMLQARSRGKLCMFLSYITSIPRLVLFNTSDQSHITCPFILDHR